MMKSELVKVAFRSDEEMHKCSTEVFTKLNEVVYFNLGREFRILREIIVNIFGTACSTQPSREVAGVLY